MPVTIISTPGAEDANSFASREEINDIIAERTPFDPAWETTGDLAAQKIITATRLIVAQFSGRKQLIRTKGSDPYYLIGRVWTGEISTGIVEGEIQSLPWPRVGMCDRFGRAIASNEIPYDLKVAQAELAGQLSANDPLTDNDVIAQGIVGIKAGPVELRFRSDMELSGSDVLPQAIFDLLVPSWYTEERVEAIAGKRVRLWNL